MVWLIHFFKRHRLEDALETVPAVAFLDRLPTKVVAEIHAILNAVAEAPPPAFGGGGKWEAMHGDMMSSCYAEQWPTRPQRLAARRVRIRGRALGLLRSGWRSWGSGYRC
jgi:hypothetical protein